MLRCVCKTFTKYWKYIFLCEHIDHNHIPASLKLKVKFLEPKFNGQRKFLQRIKKQPFVDVLQNMEASIGGVL